MGVFSLTGWSRRIRAGFLVSRVTQDTAMPNCASDKGLSPAMAPLSRGFPSHARYNVAVLQPRRCVATTPVWALPRSLATTGGIIKLFSLPRGTKMFQFPRFASPKLAVIPAYCAGGLSHSEIRGSKVICTLPRLIAAYHVLHRLHEPRHPPCALNYFLNLIYLYKKINSYFQLLIYLFNLQFCLYQYVKDLISYESNS